LATYLSGSQITFQVGSLDFNEFCLFHQCPKNNESLWNYLKFGGLPYLIHLPENEAIRFEYLNNINATILYRDVINRNKIRDTRFLNDLLKFIADNIGNIFSATKISDYLKNQQIKKNVALILDYLLHIENAYFINRVQRIDIQGKKYFDVGEKYYFEDIGLRNSLVGFKPSDIGKIIENIVFLHLKNKGFEIKIGVLESREIDFVATKNGERIYLQVVYLLADEKFLEREFGNLLKIEDNYPKYVVSFDNFSAKNTYKGIKHFTLLEFLTEF
jgi:predicted AAA+ superfamily ATPase